MIGHFEKDLLQRYGQLKLSPSELVSVVQHLENCESCYEEFNKMFPQLKTSATEFNQTILLEEEPFHLDYDEHLRPYIDETVSEVDREIIESHLEVCASCLHQVKDLQAFKQSLELKQLKAELAAKEKENFWSKLGDWLRGNTRNLAFASLLIVFVLLGLWALSAYRIQPKENETVEKEIPPVTNNNLPISTPNEIENKNTNINKNTNVNTAKPSPAAEITPPETELATLTLPKYLKDLKPNPDDLRGSNDSQTEKINLLSPIGKVIRENSPMLNWSNIDGVKNYEIIIYDQNQSELKKETVTSNSWKVPVNLIKGKLYIWQVSAKNESKNYLGQGRFYVVSQTDLNRISQAKDSLQRGKALAEAGFLDEAKKELNKFLKQNPNSEIVRKMLRQVESAQ